MLDKILEWLDVWNKEREADGDVPESEDEFDLEELSILK